MGYLGGNARRCGTRGSEPTSSVIAFEGLYRQTLAAVGLFTVQPEQVGGRTGRAAYRVLKSGTAIEPSSASGKPGLCAISQT